MHSDICISRGLPRTTVDCVARLVQQLPEFAFAFFFFVLDLVLVKCLFVGIPIICAPALALLPCVCVLVVFALRIVFDIFDASDP